MMDGDTQGMTGMMQTASARPATPAPAPQGN